MASIAATLAKVTGLIARIAHVRGAGEADLAAAIRPALAGLDAILGGLRTRAAKISTPNQEVST